MPPRVFGVNYNEKPLIGPERTAVYLPENGIQVKRIKVNESVYIGRDPKEANGIAPQQDDLLLSLLINPSVIDNSFMSRRIIRVFNVPGNLPPHTRIRAESLSQNNRVYVVDEAGGNRLPTELTSMQNAQDINEFWKNISDNPSFYIPIRDKDGKTITIIIRPGGYEDQDSNGYQKRIITITYVIGDEVTRLNERHQI